MFQIVNASNRRWRATTRFRYHAASQKAERHNANGQNAKRHNANRHNAKRHNALWLFVLCLLALCLFALCLFALCLFTLCLLPLNICLSAFWLAAWYLKLVFTLQLWFDAFPIWNIESACCYSALDWCIYNLDNLIYLFLIIEFCHRYTFIGLQW